MPRLPTTTFHSHWYWCQRFQREDIYTVYAIRVATELPGDNPDFAEATRIFEETKLFNRKQLMTVLIKYKREDLKEIGEVAKVCHPTALAKLDEFEASLTMAAAINKLNELITPDMMKDIMLLANNPLGFLTDRGPGSKDREGKPLTPYDVHCVKRCFIEATLRGARSIGNEWNIISYRAYLTKQYFERQLRDFPGLTNLRVKPSVPAVRDRGAIIKYQVSWKLGGKEDSMDREIPIRINDGMGVDAILGKGDRKIRAALFKQLTGSTWDDLDDSESGTAGEIIDTTGTVVTDPPAAAPIQVPADPEPVAEPLPEAASAPAADETPTPPPTDETPLDRVFREIEEAKSHDELKQIMDRAAKAAQLEEINSDDWSKITAARRKRAAKLGKN